MPGRSRSARVSATTKPPSRSPTRQRGACGRPSITAPASIPTTSACNPRRHQRTEVPTPRCTERNVDGIRVGPRNEQADNTSGLSWPIERVASSRRIPSWPEHLLLTKRPYTRLQPHRLPESDLLGHLQEESIHELLGITSPHLFPRSASWRASGQPPHTFRRLRKRSNCRRISLIGTNGTLHHFDVARREQQLVQLGAHQLLNGKIDIELGDRSFVRCRSCRSCGGERSIGLSGI